MKDNRDRCWHCGRLLEEDLDNPELDEFDLPTICMCSHEVLDRSYQRFMDEVVTLYVQILVAKKLTQPIPC